MNTPQHKHLIYKRLFHPSADALLFPPLSPGIDPKRFLTLVCRMSELDSYPTLNSFCFATKVLSLNSSPFIKYEVDISFQAVTISFSTLRRLSWRPRFVKHTNSFFCCLVISTNRACEGRASLGLEGNTHTPKAQRAVTRWEIWDILPAMLPNQNSRLIPTYSTKRKKNGMKNWGWNERCIHTWIQCNQPDPCTVMQSFSNA